MTGAAFWLGVAILAGHVPPKQPIDHLPPPIFMPSPAKCADVGAVVTGVYHWNLEHGDDADVSMPADGLIVMIPKMQTTPPIRHVYFFDAAGCFVGRTEMPLKFYRAFMGWEM